MMTLLSGPYGSPRSDNSLSKMYSARACPPMNFLSSGSSGKFSSFRRSPCQINAQDAAHVTAGKSCPALDGKDVGCVCHKGFSKYVSRCDGSFRNRID